MLAIATNALYTTLCRRGTTRQLATIIVLCVLAALMLLPAIFWYTLRFEVKQGALSFAEIEAILGYIALCGWLFPLGTTTAYCLFAQPRSSITALHIPRLNHVTGTDAAELHQGPPRYQPGMPVPYVYGEDAAWGWLEYRSGNFQGQRLELKRAIITIGRDDDNDIWIDDDLASRHHAELAWDRGQVYLTDCKSLNGVLVNGQRVRGFTHIKPDDLIEVGAQRFLFLLADQKQAANDIGDDPLARHTWRSSAEALDPGGEPPPATDPSVADRAEPRLGSLLARRQETTPLQEADRALLLKTGELAGSYFILDRARLTVGCSFENDIVINDPSVARQHAQLLRLADGDYIQDLTGRSETGVNDHIVKEPQMLRLGDEIHLGNISLEYISLQAARTLPLSQRITPRPLTGPISSVGPALLRLPSRQK